MFDRKQLTLRTQKRPGHRPGRLELLARFELAFVSTPAPAAVEPSHLKLDLRFAHGMRPPVLNANRPGHRPGRLELLARFELATVSTPAPAAVEPSHLKLDLRFAHGMRPPVLNANRPGLWPGRWSC